MGFLGQMGRCVKPGDGIPMMERLDSARASLLSHIVAHWAIRIPDSIRVLAAYSQRRDLELTDACNVGRTSDVTPSDAI